LDLKRFWDIIDTACPADGDEEEWYDGLIQTVAKLAPEDILAFDWRFDALTSAAYTVDLWGAAYLINGGASDDGFYYFRCWLVCKGKQVYEAALANPDSLADVVQADQEYEAEIYSAPGYAWLEATGRAIEDFWAERDKLPRNPRQELQGEDWNFDDDEEVRRRFPRLARMYLDRE
jgi:hypothetical protein